MKLRKYSIWLVLLVLLYSAWVVPSARAHALLVRSNPAANAVLEVPPVQVEIFFSEPLEENLSSIKVFDSNNVSVDVGDVRVDPSDPTRLTVSLHSLNDGVYTVTWKAVSSVDGHQTVGTFPFAVGNVNANAVSAIQQSTSFRLPFSALISKFLLLASLALLIGHRFFIALVWNPTINTKCKRVHETSDLVYVLSYWLDRYPCFHWDWYFGTGRSIYGQRIGVPLESGDGAHPNRIASGCDLAGSSWACHTFCLAGWQK